MKKIIIFGTSHAAKIFTSQIKNCSIIAFSDNNKNLIGGFFNSIIIISPKQIEFEDFDFIIIASNFYDEIFVQLKELGICSDKILVFSDMKRANPNRSFDSEHLNRMREYVSVPVVGIGPCYLYDIASDMNNQILNLAYPSQDLEMGLQLIEKHRIGNERIFIINMAFWSLEYERNKINQDICASINFMSIKEMESHGILSMNAGSKNDNNSFATELGLIEYANKYAAPWKKKKNLDIRNKNISILNKIVSIARNENIIVSFVFFPLTKKYLDIFPEEKINDTLHVINEIKKQNQNVFIYDFSSDNDFSRVDFADAEHLNKIGKYKIAKKIDRMIDYHLL